MTPALESLVQELAAADRQERIELLIDLARSLPPLPESLRAACDESHRVHECQSPVYLFLEADGPKIHFYADAPIEAPTVRGFVAMLVEGLEGAPLDEYRQLPLDLVARSGVQEILGMQRVHGLNGLIRRIRREADRVGANTHTEPQS